MLRAIGNGTARCLIATIRFYQQAVSPWKVASCRFRPTCSQYMIDAIQHRGAFVGFSLGVWRILRCNPFCRGGYDPIGPKDEPDTHAGEESPAADSAEDGQP